MPAQFGRGGGPRRGPEDRDAMGWSSKKVASFGPPVVKAYSETAEGRAEQREQRRQEYRDRQQARAERQSGRGRGRGRGNDVKYGTGAPVHFGGAGSSSDNTVNPARDYRHPPSGPRHDRTWSAEAGPSRYDNHQYMRPDRDSSAYGQSSGWSNPHPDDGPARYAPHPSSPRHDRPETFMRSARRTPPPAIVHPLPPRPAAALEPPPNPIPATASPPPTLQPPVKLKFRPNVPKRPASPELHLDTKEDIPGVDEKETAGLSADNSPQRRTDTARQRSGTLAFMKRDIPEICFGAPGKARVEARQDFKQKHFIALRAEGKTPTHAMWRDDGFAVDWERVATAGADAAPSATEAPTGGGATVATTPAPGSNGAANAFATWPQPAASGSSISAPSVIQQGSDLGSAGSVTNTASGSWMRYFEIPEQHRPLVPGGKMQPGFKEWCKRAQLEALQCGPDGRPRYKVEASGCFNTDGHSHSGEQLGFFRFKISPFRAGEERALPKGLRTLAAAVGADSAKTSTDPEPKEAKSKERSKRNLADDVAGPIKKKVKASTSHKVPSESGPAVTNTPIPLSSVPIAEPGPARTPSLPPPVPAGRAATLADLHNKLFANLDTIDNWTQMMAEYPSRAADLQKQVDRVQLEIFKIQGEIRQRKDENGPA